MSLSIFVHQRKWLLILLRFCAARQYRKAIFSAKKQAIFVERLHFWSIFILLITSLFDYQVLLKV